MSEFMKECDAMGKQLYAFYKEQVPKGLGELGIQWTKEVFWGLVVENYIPIFNKLYDVLKDGEHFTEKSGFSYGDADESVWIEKCILHKVIASKSYSICASDNTHLYILDDRYKAHGILDVGTFRITTVWENELKKEHHSYGDWRDIEEPSIETYRKANFRWGLRDDRDPGHVLTYDLENKRVDSAWATEIEMPYALQVLQMDHDAIFKIVQ